MTWPTPLVSRFNQRQRDPGEALGPLLDTGEGHAQRAMLLAHHLYERLGAGDTADIEIWVDALHAARVEAQGEIGVLWESCTSRKRRAREVIAGRTIESRSTRTVGLEDRRSVPGGLAA